MIKYLKLEIHLNIVCARLPMAHSNRSTQNEQRHSLLSKSHTVSRYMRKCNVNFARQYIIAFPAPMVTKLKIAQQIAVDILNVEFCPKRTKNVINMDTVSFVCALQYSKPFTKKTCSKSTVALRLLWKSAVPSWIEIDQEMCNVR